MENSLYGLKRLVGQISNMSVLRTNTFIVYIVVSVPCTHNDNVFDCERLLTKGRGDLTKGEAINDSASQLSQMKNVIGAFK